MSTGGLSNARLRRMHDVMAGYVERGDVPGVVTLVSRRGEVHVDAIGNMGVGSLDAIQRDTIFRISSMTKPIVAAATMILVEECVLRLDESVDRLLPELANRQVLKAIDGPLDAAVPANRPITVRDLLTLRMGFGFSLMPDTTPIEAAERAQELMTLGPPKPATPHAPDEWLRRFATLPLMHQPGERWMYPTGFSLLGVLLARAAGQPLESFLHERLFAPLSMKDTGFSVPTASLDRFATSHWLNPDSGALEVYDDVETSQWRHPPAFPDGSAGLVSTIDDCLAFGAMLLNKGKSGGERVLSRLTVEAMTTNQLSPEQKVSAGIFLGENRGWGLGVSIITKRDDVATVPGRFGWDGGLGTSWYSDPREELVGILMTQAAGFPSAIGSDFWTLAYQAIDD